MRCDGCHREDAWAIRSWRDNGEWTGSCNFCSAFTGPDIQDVYFPGPHTCQNITDKDGKPMFFSTRSEKARALKERGMSEAGDRIRGAYSMPRPSGKSWYEQRRLQGKV
jgi:hypothetical protein